MSDVPIFDSLTHPMPNGNWLLPKYDGKNSVDTLLREMAENDVQWAFAVGMGENIGGYKVETYASYIRERSDRLFPIAFVDFAKLDAGETVLHYLSNLVALGYVGIKVHPRFAQITYEHHLLAELITVANQFGLVVLLCTYYWERSNRCNCNSLEKLVELLSKVPDERMILLHGGGVRLLEMMEIARAFNNVILDLSATILKYQASSIDLDIRFLFNMFDRRICIGSDSPEYQLQSLRSRFNEFSKDLPSDKVDNIAHKNLLTLINITGSRR